MKSDVHVTALREKKRQKESQKCESASQLCIVSVFKHESACLTANLFFFLR